MITDKGLHITSTGYKELVDYINSATGVEHSQMDAVLETYKTMYKLATKSAEKLIVADIILTIGEVATSTQRHTVPLYIAQWLLYRVDTDSHQNDKLMRANMNAMAIMDLLHYLDGGPDNGLEIITSATAEKLVTIKVPFRNFLSEMQTSISFDLHSKKNRRELGSLL